MPRPRLAWVPALLVLCLALPVPAQETPPPPTTWAELDAALEPLAPTVSLLAAEVVGGTCEPIHELRADAVTPIGSSFKLYVLAELGEQIGHSVGLEDPSIAWGQEVEIEDRYRAVPHGPLLYVPEGSLYTVRYLAEQMIQVSDNTATDHLLFLLGREAVERRMAETGHHDPALNTPFLSTREFAVMKFLWPEERFQAYLAADVDERREMLSAETRGWDELEAEFAAKGDQSVPVRLETAEWFADRHDLCRVLVSLQEMAGHPGLLPLLEVLSLNDGLGLDREKWTYVGFKGGSEMGLVAGNWLLRRRDDGRLFVLSAAFANPEAALDLQALIPPLLAATELLYEVP